jgi:hypothetical protein
LSSAVQNARAVDAVGAEDSASAPLASVAAALSALDCASATQSVLERNPQPPQLRHYPEFFHYWVPDPGATVPAHDLAMPVVAMPVVAMQTEYDLIVSAFFKSDPQFRRSSSAVKNAPGCGCCRA